MNQTDLDQGRLGVVEIEHAAQMRQQRAVDDGDEAPHEEQGGEQAERRAVAGPGRPYPPSAAPVVFSIGPAILTSSAASLVFCLSICKQNRGQRRRFEQPWWRAIFMHKALIMLAAVGAVGAAAERPCRIRGARDRGRSRRRQGRGDHPVQCEGREGAHPELWRDPAIADRARPQRQAGGRGARL